MRTTLTLDDDVAALIEVERRRTGETLRQTINRMLRRAAQRSGVERPDLPRFAGGPKVDISDVSQVLGDLDDERSRDRGKLM